MSTYKYYINNIEVFPLNGDISYVFERKEEASQITLDKNIETSLIFNYISGSFNFKTQEENDKCEELEFVVKQICGNNLILFYEGVFSIIEGNFDDDKCVYKIKPRVKRYLIDDLEINFLEEPNPVLNGSVYGVQTGQFGYRNYTQARYFDKTILYIAQRSNPKINGIISNFFQINPTGAFYLPGVTNYYTKMAFCNLSDVQEPIPSNLSTIGLVKFKDLMNDLNVLFDVFWFIDSNYNLRIEHRIYFDGVLGLDLTQSPYNNFIIAKNKYNYDTSDYPKEEEWNIKNHKQKATLTYSGISNVGKKQSVKSYSTTIISTDYFSIMLYGNSSNSEGLFLFATDGNPAGWNNLNTSTIDGGRLTPFNLVKELHTYNRPNLYAVIKQKSEIAFYNKSGAIILNSVSPTKQQEILEFPLCCDVIFDTKNQIKTPMGVGFLQKASLNAKNNILKVDLKYKVDNCSIIEPNNLPGLQLWLKYNTGITQSGGVVSSWADSSGNGRNATQATVIRRPTLSGSGSNVSVTFGPGKSLSTPSFQIYPNKRGTIIILFNNIGLQSAAPPGGINVLSTNDGTASVFMDISIDANDLLVSLNEVFTYPQTIGYQNNGDLLQNGGLFIVNRYENTRIKTRQNSVNPNQNSEINSNTQTASKPLVIGENTSIGPAGNSFNIKELIIYDRSLTEEEMEKIEFYFIKKGIYFVYPTNLP